MYATQSAAAFDGRPNYFVALASSTSCRRCLPYARRPDAVKPIGFPKFVLSPTTGTSNRLERPTKYWPDAKGCHGLLDSGRSMYRPKYLQFVRPKTTRTVG